jgi:hypothetical protein
MEEDKENKFFNKRWLLILIALLPAAILVGRNIVTGTTIGYFRVVDLADLFILAPIYLFILLYLWFRMFSYGSPRWLLILYIIFAFIFMYGHAIHFTGNSLHTYITEVNDLEHAMPPDVFDMVFYLDEVFSHQVLFVAITGLIIAWLLNDQLVDAPPLLPDRLILIIPLGILYGSVMADSLIEARSLYMAIPMFLAIAGVWLWLWRRSGLPFRPFLRSRPFTTLVAIILLGAVGYLVSWFLAFGGFPQPSEVGL